VTASLEPTALRRLQHLAQTRGYAAIAHLAFPAHALALAAEIARAAGPPETRFALGRYRGWRAEGWTAVVRRGDRAAEIAWSAGGPASAWNVVTNHVAALAQAGATPIRIATGAAPLAQIHGLARSLAARHPGVAIEMVASAAPFDLGAPA
jgi:hypothetical protein